MVNNTLDIKEIKNNSIISISKYLYKTKIRKTINFNQRNKFL